MDSASPATDATVRSLEGAGYEVILSLCGEAAWFRLFEAPHDLVLLAPRLPDLPGLRLLRRIRGELALASLPVVVIHAQQIPPGEHATYLDAGANGLLQDPLSDAEFLCHLRLHLRLRELQKREVRSTNPPGDRRTLPPRRGIPSILPPPAEDELRRQSSLLLSAEQLGQMGSWSLDMRTGELRWSDATCALFGILPGQFQGTYEHFESFVLPEDLPRLRLAHTNAVALGGLLEAEYRIRRPDGEIRWMYERGSVEIEAGQVIRRLGMVMDVTEHKAFEAALRASEESLRLLAKATNDAIWDWNLITQELWWSEGFEALFGFRRDEIESTIESWIDRIHPDDRAEVLASVHAAIDGVSDGWSGEYRFLRKSGAYAHVLDRGHIVRRPDGKAVRMIGGMTDLTERKATEQQLFRAQRMESLGTLAGGIAHDLNNLLTPILTSIEMLREGERDPEKLDDLATIASCAQRGASMVRQLLTFARGNQEGMRTAVDLARIVEEVLKIVRETFPKNITTVMTSGPDVWPVRADPTQIHQLLTNLCVNARDAMPDGGVLTLTLQGKFLDDVHAKQLSGMKQGHYVLLRVEDTGTGIPLDIQDRIFEPFFTTKEVGKGTGLGLSTCHTIIKNHGGHLHLDSRPGQGTCFSIYLPAEPLTNSGKIPLPRPRIVGGRGELLLVVEDEEGIRKITARTLERAGYRVLLACDGAEAVSLYEQHRGEIAAVLIDMSMPVQDGPATIAALRAIHPGVKILATSGLGLDDRVIEALGPDLRNFLPKPYTSETLLAELNRMLRSG